jgi:hypothetical protein
MKHTAIAAIALTLLLAGCNDQPDEALPPEGELEGALPAGDATGQEAIAEEPELETIGEPEAPVMDSGTNSPGTASRSRD